MRPVEILYKIKGMRKRLISNQLQSISLEARERKSDYLIVLDYLIISMFSIRHFPSSSYSLSIK